MQHSGVQSSGRQKVDDWATRFGQLGDNVGRVVNAGIVFEIILFNFLNAITNNKKIDNNVK